MCDCDGNWECPPDKTKDICNTNPNTGCSYCVVGGKRHEGNTRFKHVNGCIEWECVCDCNGGWNCPGENARDICNTDPDTGCYYCQVGDERFAGNDYFTYRNGCIEYNCLCNCNGSWDCPGERAKDLCKLNQTSGCYYCEIDGYLYQGHSKFNLIQDCYRYDGCDCNCDGGWTCKHTRGVSVCDSRGVEKLTCEQCTYEGRTFRGDSMFYYDKDCLRYLCTCDCDGRLYCPASDARLRCSSGYVGVIASLSNSLYERSEYSNYHTRSPRQLEQCTDCRVNGKTYKAYQTFQYTAGCNTFICTCYCNGAYNCAPEKTLNECLGPSNFTGSNHGGSSASRYTSGGAGIDATGSSSGYRTSGSQSGSSSSYLTSGSQSESSSGYRTSGSQSGSSSSYESSSGYRTSGSQSGSSSGYRTSGSQSGTASGSRIGGISRFYTAEDIDSATGVNTCRNCTYLDKVFEGRLKGRVYYKLKIYTRIV